MAEIGDSDIAADCRVDRRGDPLATSGWMAGCTGLGACQGDGQRTKAAAEHHGRAVEAAFNAETIPTTLGRDLYKTPIDTYRQEKQNEYRKNDQ